MRILILSDLHGRRNRFEEAITAQDTAKTVLFLGDGVAAAEELSAFFPDREFYFVSGNCDFSSMNPTTKIISLNHTRILMTHGHKYGVKQTLENLYDTAKQNRCKIAVYGHTHLANEQYRDGIYLFNPGCLCGDRAKPSYGLIELTPQGILTNVVYL